MHLKYIKKYIIYKKNSAFGKTMPNKVIATQKKM